MPLSRRSFLAGALAAPALATAVVLAVLVVAVAVRSWLHHRSTA